MAQTQYLKHEGKIVEHLPKHAALAAQMMASSARIDSDIGRMLISLLKTAAPAAMAMYESVRNSNAKIEMVQAAADTVLGDKELSQLLADVLRVAEKALVPRNELAHWEWWATTDNTDELLLIEPRFWARQSLNTLLGPSGATLLKKPELKHHFKRKPLAVLEDEASRLLEAGSLVTAYRDFLHYRGTAKGEEIRRRLEQQADIRQIREQRDLNRLGKKKKHPQ
ncbi:MAG: hypothetical protein JSS00_02720 [Proteobacteria bacterium]|nr:hypothetical protein [Pseudomonadota bacterium]